MASLLEYFHFKETVGSVALIYSNRTVTYCTVTASIAIFQIRFFMLLHYFSVKSLKVFSIKWHVYIVQVASNPQCNFHYQSYSLSYNTTFVILYLILNLYIRACFRPLRLVQLCLQFMVIIRK